MIKSLTEETLKDLSFNALKDVKECTHTPSINASSRSLERNNSMTLKVGVKGDLLCSTNTKIE